VAETMIQRERLRREVKALTAEGRVSAIILGLLPVGLGLFMMAVNRDYISKLFDTGIGQAMLGGSVLLALAGFAWMKKIVEIEI
jgi:tight adherence protein B